MIEDKYVVDGKGLKNLPLNVAYYARSPYIIWNNWEDNEPIKPMTILKSHISEIKNFIDNQTKWNLIAGYEDCGYSALDYESLPEFMEMVSDACSREKPFEVIVVTSISQITRNVEDIPDLLFWLSGNDITLFCIDTQSFITTNPYLLKTKFPERTTLNYIATLERMKDYLHTTEDSDEK